MRLFVFIALLLTGCGAAAPGTQDRQFPAVEELDRITSGSHGDRDLLEITTNVTEYSNLPTLGWLIEPDSDEPDWVILRIPYKEEIADKPWLNVTADTPEPVVGFAACGVADYATGRWIWQDPTVDWLDTGNDVVGVPLTEDCQPWSPAGYCYVAVVAWGEGSSVVANGLATIRWEGP